MKKIKILAILTAAFAVCIPSCGVSKKSTGADHKSYEAVYLFQDGKEQRVYSNSVVTVNRDKFSIRFFNQKYDAQGREYHAAKIAAFLDPEELNKIEVGMDTRDLPCFEPGSGIAAYFDRQYECLFFNHAGHHYVYYEDAEHRRLDLIQEGEVYHKLEFQVDELWFNRTKESSMKETDLSEFYLAILIDRNLDEIIDPGELTKLTIKLKD